MEFVLGVVDYDKIRLKYIINPMIILPYYYHNIVVREMVTTDNHGTLYGTILYLLNCSGRSHRKVQGMFLK